MKALAYLRWSTDDQTAGNSLERQTANVEAYCQRNALELIETLADDGLSAFKGEHLSRGKLGQLLAKADKGRYRGFCLVVEQMDRLSRQGIDETWQLVRRILKNGIELHITQQNRVVRSLDDLPTVIMQAVESFSAQEYSRKLKERVSAAWSDKKHKGENGVSITSKLPAWLDGVTGQPITVNATKADIVRQIFELASQGIGKRLIARRLNEKGVPTFSRGKRKAKIWGHSYIEKILHNRAVLGDYQPYVGKGSERKPDGDVRIGFYPAIIKPDLWQRAQESLSSRRTITAGGEVTGLYPGKTGKLHNLFTGLIFEWISIDEWSSKTLPMHYVDKGKRSRPKLTIEKTSDIDKPHAIDYADFEPNFLRFLDQLDWTSILDASDTTNLRQVEESIAHISLDIERAETQIQKITDLLIDTPSKALKDRLLQTEAEIERYRIAREDAIKHLGDVRRKHQDLLSTDIVFARLAKATDFETRARLRQEIRRKVKRIDVWFPGPPGHIAARISFTNGVTGSLLWQEGQRTIAFTLDPRLTSPKLA
jgi:DNA invertase Pin-like site-specific DNA recombinase